MKTSKRRKNQNLTADEAAILRGIAGYHGYTQTRGRGAGEEGSSFRLLLAIVQGDAQVISFDQDELRPLVAWLHQQAEQQRDTPMGETIADLAAQLAITLPPPIELPPPTGEPGPINTLEG